MIFAQTMLVAIVLDLALGWPGPLYRRIGHPVTWIGRAIARLDRDLNAGPSRRARGALATAAVIAAAGGAGWLAQALLPGGTLGAMLCGVLAWPLLAMRSLRAHVVAVTQPLLGGDLGAARRAVAMIVGRETERLDAAGVTRAALESLAENSADGIVAPLFWGLVAGLPGIAAYKAVNTLDSMIGHRNERFREFGWAAARIDDLANLIPARLTALLLAVVSGRARVAMTCALRDAGQHRSPNGGWPEAAMAGALGVRLSGPRAYGGRVVDEPWINAAGRDCRPTDLGRGLELYGRAMAVCVALTAILALI